MIPWLFFLSLVSHLYEVHYYPVHTDQLPNRYGLILFGKHGGFDFTGKNCRAVG